MPSAVPKPSKNQLRRAKKKAEKAKATPTPTPEPEIKAEDAASPQKVEPVISDPTPESTKVEDGDYDAMDRKTLCWRCTGALGGNSNRATKKTLL